MRKKSREITVFSLSALDLFCSAMGVFMILCLVLFPHHKQQMVATPATPQQPNPAPPAPAMPTDVKVVPSLSVAMYSELQLVHNGQAQWTEVAVNDIDLYVEAPQPDGRRVVYSYKQKMHPNSPAMLLTDSMKGGGESWLHPKVTLGTYRVSFSVTNAEHKDTISTKNKHNNSITTYNIKAVRIVTTIVTPDGVAGGADTLNNILPPHVIPISEFRTDPNKRIPLADIQVSANGAVTIKAPVGK